MTLTRSQLEALPVWWLDRMSLPRGGFSAEDRKAAQNEIKRRFGFPDGAIKVPAPPPPIDESLKLVAIPGGGWLFLKQEL